MVSVAPEAVFQVGGDLQASFDCSLGLFFDLHVFVAEVIFLFLESLLSIFLGKNCSSVELPKQPSFLFWASGLSEFFYTFLDNFYPEIIGFLSICQIFGPKQAIFFF